MTDTGKNTAGLRFYAVFATVLAFFFISGACGLAYQVAWTRQLALLLGVRAYAVSLVLSVFFLGLGLGSFWGGRRADKTHRPLRVYALMETGIGLWALLLLALLDGVGPAVAGLLRLTGGGFAAGASLRAVIAAVLLLAPVWMMGATLPLLSRFVARDPALRGRRVGLLYTVNTLGAAAGCFTAGFVLLPGLGYSRTVLLAAVLNLAVGAAAELLHRVLGRQETQDDPVTEPGVQCHSGTPMTGRLVFAFAVSGFAALALEVVWTRLLAMVFLGTTYAYTAMLATLLCGLALGGMAGSALAPRLRNAAGMAGSLLLLLGVMYMLLVHGFAWLPEKFGAVQAAAGNRWEGVTWGMFRLSFMILFPATFVSGMVFPVLVRAVAQNTARVGRDIGLLYGANTLGGVLGAAVGGFVLLPLLGAQRAMTLLALLPALAGLPLLLGCPCMPPARRVLTAAVFAAALAVAWWRGPGDISRVLNASYMPKDHEVVFYHEGTEGTVAVSQPRGVDNGTERVLWINRVQATTSIERGVRMNRLQGALPLLFDRDPGRILFMCFGSGITCGTLALSDFKHIDAVELSPDVLRAAPFFSRDNLGVLDRPNIRFVVDDGRNFMLTAQDKYDVITFEPMPLAVAGVSAFYTEDYYRLCLSRLAPGGLVSQWVPLHSLNPEVVRSLAFTFTRVFPEYCAFFINADLFLIGSNAPLRLDLAKARERLAVPELAAALRDAGLPDVVELMGCFIMDKPALDGFSAGGGVMTDDRPWAEYLAPKLVYERKVPDSLERLLDHVTGPLVLMDAAALSPEDKSALERRTASRKNDLSALREYYGGFVLGEAAMTGFLESLRIDPENPNARYYLGQITAAQVEALVGWEECAKAARVMELARPYCSRSEDWPRLEALLAGCGK